ncbi:MAG: hypothetical protein LBV55_02080 [Acholeplasmatales bacterium]|jgi:M6 family metalloprotease-like protein|nr:hypothetical protein [Acholeplasmatales bacterium]
MKLIIKTFTSTKKLILALLVVMVAVLLVGCQSITKNELEYFNAAYVAAFEGKDFSNISADFTLPTTSNEVSISYESANSQILSVSGGSFSVHPTAETQVVQLTVTFTYQGDTIQYYINVVVSGTQNNTVEPPVDNDPELAKQAWAEIIAALFSNVDPDGKVTKDLIFLKKVNISSAPRATWNSSNVSIISKEGLVLQPLNGNVNVKISANLRIAKAQIGTAADYNVTRDFYFTVPKFNIPWNEVIDFAPSDTSSAPLLSEDIVSKGLVEQFPTNPANGTVDVNIVVIPVEFSDDHFTPDELVKVQKAFFGDRSDTGWESLASFYNKSSYGRVNINGTLTSTYNTGKTIAQFQSSSSIAGKAWVDYQALYEGLTAKVSELTLSQHDGNNDGYIDGVYLVYSAPQQDAAGGVYPPYWTYHNFYKTTNYNKGDYFFTQAGVDYRPYGYVWYSYENINESIKELDININAEILVHESGRFFGLPYYYEYAYGPEVQNGLGYMDMMYANIGDHGPWSKLVLGWIDPIVVSEAGTTLIKLKDAPTYGDLIMVKPTWPTDSTYYGEYLLIDYYAPTGLYEMQTTHTSGYPVFTTRGVRIYHVTYNQSKTFNPSANNYVAGMLIKYLTGDGAAIPTDGPINDQALFQPGCAYDWSKFVWATSPGSAKDNVLVRVLEINADDEYAVISISLS